jgi:hypothetical protein
MLAHPSDEEAAVTGDDLFAIAPWLAFTAGLAMIGYRLLARDRPPAPPAPHSRTQQAPPAGRRQPPGTGSASRDASR